MPLTTRGAGTDHPSDRHRARSASPQPEETASGSPSRRRRGVTSRTPARLRGCVPQPSTAEGQGTHPPATGRGASPFRGGCGSLARLLDPNQMRDGYGLAVVETADEQALRDFAAQDPVVRTGTAALELGRLAAGHDRGRSPESSGARCQGAEPGARHMRLRKPRRSSHLTGRRHVAPAPRRALTR